MPAKVYDDATPGTMGLEDLSFYLGRTYHHYCLVLQDSLTKHGLTKHLRPGMGPVVFALFEREEQTLRELGEAADLSPSTVTEMVQKLEAAGMVVRKRCSKDGRAVRVSLTELGWSLRENIEAVSREVNGLLQQGMSASEARSLKTVLAKMVTRMRVQRTCAHAERTTVPASERESSTGKRRHRQ